MFLEAPLNVFSYMRCKALILVWFLPLLYIFLDFFLTLFFKLGIVEADIYELLHIITLHRFFFFWTDQLAGFEVFCLWVWKCLFIGAVIEFIGHLRLQFTFGQARWTAAEDIIIILSIILLDCLDRAQFFRLLLRSKLLFWGVGLREWDFQRRLHLLESHSARDWVHRRLNHRLQIVEVLFFISWACRTDSHLLFHCRVVVVSDGHGWHHGCL